MARMLLALLLLVLRLPAAAQAPAWRSAQEVAGSAAMGGNSSVVSATAVDATGNVYLAGYFTNSVVMGGTTLTSAGSTDVFVAKYSPVSNQVVWAQRAGGAGEDYAIALAVSGPNVYVAGEFTSNTASFGTTTFTNYSAGGYSDGFVAKLTDAGPTASFAWARQVGGRDFDYASALAVSGPNVYLAGSFYSTTAGFGSTTLTNTSGAGGTNAFVAKLIDAGLTSSFAWVQQIGGTISETATALAASGASVYVAGHFNSPTLSFGASTLTIVDPARGPDVFVAKLTDAGTTASYAWAQQAGGDKSDYVNALAIRGTSVYIAGNFFSSSAAFGTTTLTNASTSGSTDAYVAKLTDAGTTSGFVWAYPIGGTDFDRADALAVSGTSVFVTGRFSSPTASFGATTLTNVGINSSADMFLAKLSDTGPAAGFTWAQRGGGSGSDYATALAVSGPYVYVGGYFFGATTASFGAATLSNPNSFSGTRGYLASLSDPTLTAATAPAGPREPATLFPNPARHAATLRLPAGTVPAPLTLTDALGRTVRRYPAPTGTEATLDLRGLPAGLYLLHGAGLAQRLVVE